MKKHLRILDFAVASLGRNPAKTLAVLTIYSLLVAVVASLLLYLQACRREVRHLLSASPEIVVQRTRGGRHELSPVGRAAAIRDIRGVGRVSPRIWGYSFDPPTGATLTFWGFEGLPPALLDFTEEGPEGGDLESGCVIGSGLAELRFLGIGDRFPIRRFDGTLFAPRVVGIFSANSALLTNDLVVLPTADLRRVFGIDDDLCTDISVEVHNSNEVTNIARKIQERWPDARIITRSQILQTCDALFDWRGGVWAATLLSCVAAFAILIWDKGTGLTEEEFRTIGLLKAVGWKSREVMELKLLEGSVISAVALATGFVIAMIHLLWFDGLLFARVVKGWSVLFPTFRVNPEIEWLTVMICVLLTAVPYAIASLIPSWRAAITDPDTVLRS